jgi:hypothetical protein
MADVTSPFAFPYPEDTDLVRDGATDIENLAEGVNDYLAGGYLYAGQIRYTSSGSFVKADPFGTGDIGLRAIRVRMVGGGGGSGGTEATGATEVAASAGGGGAGYAEKFITDIAGLLTSETITRGAAGSGGSAGNNAGTAGTASTAFGLTAGGGSGGSGGPAAVPAQVTVNFGTSAGTSSGGDINLTGAGPGLPYIASTDRVSACSGGGSLLGAGGRVGNLGFGGTPSLGQEGVAFGGGAGGVAAAGSTTATAGRNGANGIVIVDVFI